MKTLLITSGDPDGVGLEVSQKALTKIGPQKDIRFVLIQSRVTKSKQQLALQKKFVTSSHSSIDDALMHPSKNRNALMQVELGEDSGQWVKAAAKVCLKRKDAGLVTGPISKDQMRRFGHGEIGHTEIFKKLTKNEFLFQTYLGSKFNVMLVTDHIALANVSQKITTGPLLVRALEMALEVKKRFRMKKKIAVLGLNPHAGENGLIGNEDQFISKLLSKMNEKGGHFIGPLPADSAFGKSQLKSIDLFVALYHDQGLIPFKMAHGFDEGVHLTMGIPFVRTSVDHGTAKELFGKNKAEYGSMFHAIKTAITLLRSDEKI